MATDRQTTVAEMIDDLLTDERHLGVSERDLRTLNFLGRTLHQRGLTAEQRAEAKALYQKYVGPGA